MSVFNKQVPLFWRKIHGLFHQRRPAGPAGPAVLFRVTIDQALADDLELQDVQCIAWYTHFLILYIYCYHILIVYVFVYINRHISTFIQYIVYHICIIYNIYIYVHIYKYSCLKMYLLFRGRRIGIRSDVRGYTLTYLLRHMSEGSEIIQSPQYEMPRITDSQWIGPGDFWY